MFPQRRAGSVTVKPTLAVTNKGGIQAESVQMLARLFAREATSIRSVERKVSRRVGIETPEESHMPCVLIIDDEESIRFSMSEYFSLHGYEVDTAREWEEAEKLLQSREFKAVIQDLRLGRNGDTEGLDMIRTIRAYNPQTRIIVLTAYGSAEMEEEARRYGADAFLRKPKPLSEVAQVVQGLIESPGRQVEPVPDKPLAQHKVATNPGGNKL